MKYKTTVLANSSCLTGKVVIVGKRAIKDSAEHRNSSVGIIF